MTTVVLGASGFIGSHVLEALCKTKGDSDDHLIGVASYRSDGALGWLGKVKELYPFVETRRGDITDPEFLKSLTPDGPETWIYNFAAHVSVPGSVSLPLLFWDVNATSVVRLLNIFPNSNVVHTSTSEVFAGVSSARQPYQLESHADPVSWYGASKAAAEMAVRASRKHNHIFVRLFNTFGPRQYPRAVIPYMIRQALAVKNQRKTKATLGDPASIRGFHFVEDIARAFAALRFREFTGPMQWASSNPITMRELWEEICSSVGIDEHRVEWQPEQRPQAIKVPALFGVTSKNTPSEINAILGSTPLRKGIDYTKRWLHDNPTYASEEYYQ